MPSELNCEKNKEAIVKFDGREISLPGDLQDKIIGHWEVQIESGRKYFNGELFMLDEIVKGNEVIKIIVQKTNFAHFLYNREVDSNLGQYNIHTVFASALIITADDRIIVGKMGEHTSRAGKYQFSGGGLEDGDIKNGICDMKHSMQKELMEELGIDSDDNNRVEQIKFYCIKKGNNGNIAVIYLVKLKEIAEEFLQKYNLFTQELKENGKLPEFEKIIYIKQNKKDIEKFIKINEKNLAGYMSAVLRSIIK